MEKRNMKQLITDNIVVIVLILLVIGFSIGNSTFITPANIINLLGQMCLNAILASGLTYVIILGGIDISVGSCMAITGILAAQLTLKMGNVSTPVAILIQVGVGVGAGAVSGAELCAAELRHRAAVHAADYHPLLHLRGRDPG